MDPIDLLKSWNFSPQLLCLDGPAPDNIYSAKVKMVDKLDLIFTGLAAVAAGTVNALAGGGTLITFPVLVAVGVPPVEANVTNTVALCPGYLGATLAQRADMRGRKERLWLLLPAAIVGGIVGGILLLHTGERTFRMLIPFLILLASVLLALQEPIRSRLTHQTSHSAAISEFWAVFPVGLAAVYGGYFGAGLSVIVLSVLAVMIDDSLTRLNALKQAIAFCVNIAAAILFLFSGLVHWSMMVVMALGSLAGGVLGGRLAGRIKPAALRWTVVTVGIIVSTIYFLR
jgi:uncharacterized membrane protein YfcA